VWVGSVENVVNVWLVERICGSIAKRFEPQVIISMGDMQRYYYLRNHIEYLKYMVAEEHAIAHIPQDLDPKDAGPLMCGGITTFNALRNSGAVAGIFLAGNLNCNDYFKGDVVVIQGLGGLGHLAVQYARKMGFYTVVASR
jgi:NADPH:quinone reductase-like Zn-dependent oxidoreductase